MGAPASGRNDAIVGINVTPLVDITLVLLLIFMVTAKLVVSQAMPLDLPKAASAGETQTVFAIAIDDEGHVRANGRPVANDAELRRLAREALARTPDLRTVVQASTRVPYGTVIHALDELRQVGVSRVAFGVDKIGAEPVP
jgi:biopolymer transport protein ExbD